MPYINKKVVRPENITVEKYYQDKCKTDELLEVEDLLRKYRRKMEKQGKHVRYIVEIESKGRIVKTIKSRNEPSKIN